MRKRHLTYFNLVSCLIIPEIRVSNDDVKLLDPKFARFCLLPKIHKRLHDVPDRTVISNCSFCTENISSFLDYHFQSLAQGVKSHIKDTNHFLNMTNKIGKLPEEAILCTHQFLDPTSSHPYHCKKGILYSQNLRLNMICSPDNQKFNKHCTDLVKWLTSFSKCKIS